jgi:hypothetical protein
VGDGLIDACTDWGCWANHWGRRWMNGWWDDWCEESKSIEKMMKMRKVTRLEIEWLQAGIPFQK